jgi:hypothetical protein
MASLGSDLWTLAQHPVFLLNMLAYCPVQGAFGAYTFWGPKVRVLIWLCMTLFPLPGGVPVQGTFGAYTFWCHSAHTLPVTLRCRS